MRPTSPRATRAALALAVVAVLASACGDKQTADSASPSATTAAGSTAPSGTAVLFEPNQTVAVTGPEFVAWRDRMLSEGGNTKLLQVTGRAYANEKAGQGEDLGRARAEAASILFMEALPPERILLRSQPAAGEAPSGRFEAVAFEWVEAPPAVVAAASDAQAGTASAPAASVAAPASAGAAPAVVAAAPAPAAPASAAPAAGTTAATPATTAAATSATPAAAAEPVRSLVLYFNSGSGSPKLGKAERQQLQALVKSAGDAAISVVGHADNQGARERNQALSETRAQAVQRLLVQLGARANTLQVAGVGDREPAQANDAAQGRAQNRRVEIKVL
ncbi:OmpA family protein [Caldimonas brevitalea]|uniref:OmpA-like domain-containing protein n=1 Tax=Caldimonas brevitalea TaxID=413882 RepID=A0A0G3BLL8_9BURK|nr:OmpA family protein [Caldimonas brevitalea]AKJ28888.1 hypothetical protein AAW51_2197 [Caldimonas brevitalea]